MGFKAKRDGYSYEVNQVMQMFKLPSLLCWGFG